MTKFGNIKSQLLHKLTEAFEKGNKSEIKKILKSIRKEKDFKDVYLFYEELENKYIEDKDSASLFVENFIPILTNKLNNVLKFCTELSKEFGNIDVPKNEIYECVDTLIEKDTLQNIDKKIISKKKLVEHLTTKKVMNESQEQTFVPNESLLHTVLTNNFNVLYGSTLSEEEQKELKEILSYSKNDLEEKFKLTKEHISKKISEILNEEKNPEVLEKLAKVINEMQTMDTSRFNYYKLKQLENGL